MWRTGPRQTVFPLLHLLTFFLTLPYFNLLISSTFSANYLISSVHLSSTDLFCPRQDEGYLVHAAIRGMRRHSSPKLHHITWFFSCVAEAASSLCFVCCCFFCRWWGQCWRDYLVSPTVCSSLPVTQIISLWYDFKANEIMLNLCWSCFLLCVLPKNTPNHSHHCHLLICFFKKLLLLFQDFPKTSRHLSFLLQQAMKTHVGAYHPHSPHTVVHYT